MERHNRVVVTDTQEVMLCYRLGGFHPSPTLVLVNDVGLPPASPLMNTNGADEGELF